MGECRDGGGTEVRTITHEGGNELRNGERDYSTIKRQINRFAQGLCVKPEAKDMTLWPNTCRSQILSSDAQCFGNLFSTNILLEE